MLDAVRWLGGASSLAFGGCSFAASVGGVAVSAHFFEQAGEVGDELLFTTHNAGEVEDFVLFDVGVADALDEAGIAFDQKKGILGGRRR